MHEHRFHRDHGSHSVTVNLRRGLHTEIELLVDGKEVGLQRVHGHGPWTVRDALPDDPPRPFTVRVGSEGPSCVLELDGAEWPMSV
ncbi:hypothetical protein OHV05_13735 [Kitasatospora sp. NBC_00070]|uniref:hypothetical protein n=1 Tax=Kitasatospora sp. NBC_00070 TaxID=2975962 RepID=UPI00325647FC